MEWLERLANRTSRLLRNIAGRLIPIVALVTWPSCQAQLVRPGVPLDASTPASSDFHAAERGFLVDLVPPQQDTAVADAEDLSSCQVDPTTYGFAIGAPVVARPVTTTFDVSVASTKPSDIKAAIQKITANGGGSLHFPRGEYVIELDDNGQRTVMSFEKLARLKISGVGNKTVLKIANDPRLVGSGVKLIRVQDVGSLEVHSMQLVGAREHFVAPGTPEIGEEHYWNARISSDRKNYDLHNQREQQSLLFVRDIPNGAYIHDMTFLEAGGDGLNFAGAHTVVVSNSTFDFLDRNGLTIGGNRGIEKSQDVLIENNYFGANIDTQQVDTELHGAIGFSGDPDHLNRNIQVRDNVFARQVPEDTIDGDQFAMTITETDIVEFSNNTLASPLRVVDALNVHIAGNTSITGLRLIRQSSALIASNAFVLAPMQRFGITGGIDLEEASGLYPSKVALVGNAITSSKMDEPIRITDVREVHVQGNTIQASDATKILLLHAQSADMDAFTLDNGIAPDDISVRQTGTHEVTLVTGKKTFTCR